MIEGYDDGVRYEGADDLDKEARELTPEKAQRKLTELAQESHDFSAFKATLSNKLWWYLGQPMPDPYRSWTWAQFEQFYNQVKGIK
jgi:hypothetical protein